MLAIVRSEEERLLVCMGGEVVKLLDAVDLEL